MPIRIDFSQVDEQNNLQPGRYPIIVDSVQVKDASDGMSQYLEWYVIVSQGEFEGRKLRMITSLKSKALWRLKAVLRAIDLDVQGEIGFETDDEDFVVEPDIVGRVGVAEVSNNTYEGTTRSQCDTILHIDEWKDESAPMVKSPDLALANGDPKLPKTKMKLK